MAKVNGVATQLSGKVGQLIYRQTKYGTVVYEAPSKASVPLRTEAQMQIRTQWANLGAVYRQFNQTLKKGFEGLMSTDSLEPRTNGLPAAPVWNRRAPCSRTFKGKAVTVGSRQTLHFSPWRSFVPGFASVNRAGSSPPSLPREVQ